MTTYIGILTLIVSLIVIILRMEGGGKILKTKWFCLSWIVAWYDVWVGVYYRKDKGRYFILFAPCIGITFTWYKKLGGNWKQRLTETGRFSAGKPNLAMYVQHRKKEQSPIANMLASVDFEPAERAIALTLHGTWLSDKELKSWEYWGLKIV